MTSATLALLCASFLFDASFGVKYVPRVPEGSKEADAKLVLEESFPSVPDLDVAEILEPWDTWSFEGHGKGRIPFDPKTCIALVEQICAACSSSGEGIPDFECYKTCIVEHKTELMHGGCMMSMSDLSGGLLHEEKHCPYMKEEGKLSLSMFSPEGPFGPEVCGDAFPSTLQSQLLLGQAKEHVSMMPMKKGPFLPPSCVEKVKELCGYCSGDPTSPLTCFETCVKENRPALDRAGCPPPPTPECETCMKEGLEHIYNVTYRKISTFCMKHEDEPKLHEFCEFAKNHPAEAVVAVWCHMKIPVWKIVMKKCSYVCKPPLPPPPRAGALRHDFQHAVW